MYCGPLRHGLAKALARLLTEPPEPQGQFTGNTHGELSNQLQVGAPRLDVDRTLAVEGPTVEARDRQIAILNDQNAGAGGGAANAQRIEGLLGVLPTLHERTNPGIVRLLSQTRGDMRKAPR